MTDQGVKLDVPTGVIVYQQRPLDVAFDDVMMDDVRSTWKTIVGDECTDEFMVFADIATDVE